MARLTFVLSLGGFIGIILQLNLTWVPVKFLDVPFIFETNIVIIAFVFVAFVGVAFGFPLRRTPRAIDLFGYAVR